MDLGPVKKVSKKKIVFVQLDEEITTLFERVRKSPYKDLYFVVPKRAVLLQSVVNLKILKQKLEEVGKEMAMITEDPNGMKLAHQAEIRIFDHWDFTSHAEEKKDADSALLKPIAAASNEWEEKNPSRLPQKKSSIFEVVRHVRSKEKGFSLGSYLKERKRNIKEREPFKFTLPGGTKRFLTAAVLVSGSLFFFIAYVVLPGATIAIQPASAVVSKAINITLDPTPSGPQELKSYTVTTETELTVSHPATGAESEGSDATGTITVYNETGEDRPLIAQTRFQTNDGIVFRIQQEVTVPKASGGVPGTLDVFVKADPLDANGTPVGARGNVEPTNFFLPGLREDTRDEVYGKSTQPMTGATSDVRMFIVEEDLLAARAKLETELKEKALSALRKEVLSQSNILGVELKLLEDSDVIVYGTPDITTPGNLVGQEVETFDVTGSITITGIAYDSEALLAILKGEIISAATPGKRLVRIDENSISLDVFESNMTAKTVQFTAQIQGIEEYEIDPEFEGGSQLADKIKEHVAGKSMEEAEQYIQNLPEVNRVEIKSWPIWSPGMPTLPENIRIKSLSNADPIE